MKKKLTINTLALGNLKQRRKQYTILIIGIILAMVFSSGTLFFISCMKSSQEELIDRRQGKQDVIILNAQDLDFSPAIEHGDIDGEIGYAHVLCYANSKNNKANYGITIGWLDERAKELYYQQLSEGRFPESSGEIAVEKSVLGQMKIEAEIGDKITLLTHAADGEGFLPKETEQTYTLVGILEDRRIYLDRMYYDAYQISQFVPSAFVADGEQVALGGKESLVALVDEIFKEGSRLYEVINDGTPLIDTQSIYGFTAGDTYITISNSATAFAFLCVLLAFASCVAIVNSFSNNLKERKDQIGMLRAVGATKRQIINIFGREAFIISLISAPISTALAYLTVKIFAVIMGENFIFIPDFTVLILGAVLGVICVMLAALIPLFGISKLSPMQAIRDIEMMRKMKNRKIKSQKKFSVPRLLAKRNLTFSPGRRVVVSLLLCVTTLVACFSMSFLFSESKVDYFTRFDYSIRSYGGGYSSNTFINSQRTDSPLAENSRQDCLSLPWVKSVLGEKLGTINVLIDGEYPEYLRINEYMEIENSSRFITGWDTVAEGMPNITKENIDEFMSAGINPDYTYTKHIAGYTQEIFNSPLSAKSGELIEKLGDDLLYGKIDLKKLDSGEEIIICAPDKIGYSYEVTSDSGSVSGLLNLSSEDKSSAYDKRSRDHVIKTAESPFKIGDTLTLSFLFDDGTGKVTRTDRQVKIGAITGKSYHSSDFIIYTTLDGLQKLGGGNLDYEELGVMLKEDATAETDEAMQTALEEMLPNKHIMSKFAFNEGEKEEFRLMALAVISMIVIFSCVCISLINNSISSQIRYSKKAIGTLRAVGASARDFALAYFLQVLSMVMWGFGSGAAAYTIARYILGLMTSGDTVLPFVLWPVLVLMAALLPICFINIKAKVKQVMKHSIVENIREL